MKKIRIGDIELKTTKEGRIEIVKWQKNDLYDRRDEFVTEDGQTFRPKDQNPDEHWISYDVSCFKNPETCYVLADIVFDSAGDEFDVEAVGMRPWELEPEDEKDFKEVLNLFNKHFAEDLENKRYEY